MKAAALLAAVVSFASAQSLPGATAPTIEAARKSPDGIWLLHRNGEPSGVFFELKQRGRSFEARVVRAPLGTEWKKGDRVKLPANLKMTGVSEGHNGIWAQAVEGEGFYAERGCCDDRYWFSASWDLNGDWTAVEGATGGLGIGGVRDRFGASPHIGYSGPEQLNFREISPGRFDGTLKVAGASRNATFTLTRQDGRAARAQCGGRPRLQLRATYDGGAFVLQRCPA